MCRSTSLRLAIFFQASKLGWHTAKQGSGDWKKLVAPEPWERQGVTQDNPRSPGNAPYRPGDMRFGDKPYNGYAWYRKGVLLPAKWEGKKIQLASGQIQNWARIFVNGKPLGKGEQSPPPTHEVPAGLLQFGQTNVIAIQVYNHDNFGGIISGPFALFVEGNAPELVETPGPLSFVKEYAWPSPGTGTGTGTHLTFLAGAMSPTVMVAVDEPKLELWGWEARGFAAPTNITFAAKKGMQRLPLNPDGGLLLNGATMSENWIRLQGAGADALIGRERCGATRWPPASAPGLNEISRRWTRSCAAIRSDITTSISAASATCRRSRRDRSSDIGSYGGAGAGPPSRDFVQPRCTRWRPPGSAAAHLG